jgi:hypothetical protein
VLADERSYESSLQRVVGDWLQTEARYLADAMN